MDPSVLPLKVYIFDITDTWKKTGTNAEHIRKVDIATINYLAFFYPNKISSSLAEYCFWWWLMQVEYEVESCHIWDNCDVNIYVLMFYVYEVCTIASKSSNNLSNKVIYKHV